MRLPVDRRRPLPHQLDQVVGADRPLPPGTRHLVRAQDLGPDEAGDVNTGCGLPARGGRWRPGSRFAKLAPCQSREDAMAYDLDQFIADCKTTLAREPGPKGREQVRVNLEKLLANPDFIRAYTGDDQPRGVKVLYEDPKLGFQVLAHINEKAHASPPHDHGASWAIYGQAAQYTDMTEWAHEDDGKDPAVILVRPFGHVGVLGGLAVDRPGRAVIVRRRGVRLFVDMGEHLEAELGILVQHFDAARLVVAGVGADEVGIGEQLLEIDAHLFAPLRAGIARKRGFAIGDELIEVVGHFCPPRRNSMPCKPEFSRKKSQRASLR